MSPFSIVGREKYSSVQSFRTNSVLLSSKFKQLVLSNENDDSNRNNNNDTDTQELDTLDTGSIISLAMDISLVDELAPILGPTILGPKRLDSD